LARNGEALEIGDCLILPPSYNTEAISPTGTRDTLSQIYFKVTNIKDEVFMIIPFNNNVHFVDAFRRCISLMLFIDAVR
jgi:hypothetical protein